MLLALSCVALVAYVMFGFNNPAKDAENVQNIAGNNMTLIEKEIILQHKLKDLLKNTTVTDADLQMYRASLASSENERTENLRGAYKNVMSYKTSAKQKKALEQELEAALRYNQKIYNDDAFTTKIVLPIKKQHIKKYYESLKNNDAQLDGIVYKVTNTKNKTVSVSGGAAATLKIPSKITIQNETYTVTAIDAKAFSRSPVIKKVVVSDTITDIGDQAFAGCKNITSVTIGKNVKTIGKKAFYNCKKLKSVTVKNKAKLNKVGSKAFQKTAKKISIKLPKNLKKNKKLKNQLKKAGIKKFK